MGCDLDPIARRQAVPLGVVDRVSADIAEAVEGADLIMLAVPVMGMHAVLEQLAALPLERAVITECPLCHGDDIACPNCDGTNEIY